MAHGKLTVYFGNTLLNVRMNKSAACQLFVVSFGFNLISYSMEKWTIQHLIFAVESFTKNNSVISVKCSMFI